MTETNPSSRGHADSEKWFQLSFNWAWLLAGATFFAYAIFGAPLRLRATSPLKDVAGAMAHGLAMTLAVHITTLAIFVYFLWLALAPRLRGVFAVSWTIEKPDRRNAVLFAVATLGLCWPELWVPLVSDEIAHAQEAFGHTYFPLLKLAPRFPSVSIMPAWLVLWVVNLAILGVVLVGARLLYRKPPLVLVTVLIGLFIAAKAAVLIVGGGGMSHPPLRLLPLWLAGTLFTPTVIGFRLATVLALVVALVAIARITRPRLGDALSVMLAFAIGTTPCILGVAVLVESSFWTAMVWLILALLMVDRDADFLASKEFLVSGVSLVALTTMLRQSAFVILVPMSVAVLWHWKNRATTSVKTFLMLASPVLLFIPFLAKSILLGTPANYSPGDFGVIGEELGSIGRVLTALRMGIVQQSAVNALYPWGVATLIIAILPIGRGAAMRVGLLLLLLAAACFIFFSIRPALWGTPRYQSEYLSLFVGVGLLRVVLFLRAVAPARATVIACGVLGALCIVNAVAFRTLPAQNAPAEERVATGYPMWTVRGLSEFNYDHRSAYRALLAAGVSDRVFIAGLTYGAFSGVLYGDTFKALGRQSEIYRRLNGVSDASLPSALAENRQVEAVLVVERLRRSLVDQLAAKGWRLTETFADSKHGSTIYLLRRGPTN